MKLLFTLFMAVFICNNGFSQDYSLRDTLRTSQEWDFKDSKNSLSIGLHLQNWSSDYFSIGYSRNYISKTLCLTANYGFSDENTNTLGNDGNYMELKEIYDSAVVFHSFYMGSEKHNFRIGITRYYNVVFPSNYSVVAFRAYYNLHTLIGYEERGYRYSERVKALSDNVSDSYLEVIDSDAHGSRIADYMNLGVGFTIGVEKYFPWSSNHPLLNGISLRLFWNLATYGVSVKLKDEIFDDDDSIYSEPFKSNSSIFMSNIGVQLGMYF